MPAILVKGKFVRKLLNRILLGSKPKQTLPLTSLGKKLPQRKMEKTTYLTNKVPTSIKNE